MPANRSTRAARKIDADDVLKRPAPGADQEVSEDAPGAGAPAIPDLNTGALEPEAWLALQQAIGNSAVGGMVARRRAGQPLPAEARHGMEASFGRNFGQVQVHAGPEVDQAAQTLDAAAFTVGPDIFVHSALPSLDDPFGREILGEELAHVAQGAGQQGAERLTSPSETAETEAHRAGVTAAAGGQAPISAAPETADAVARFTLSSLFKLAQGQLGGDVATAAEPKTDLADDEKERLKAGALDPLTNLWTLLGDKLVEAQNGKPSPQAISSIAENATGIGQFIASFTGPPAVQPTLQSAAVAASAGRNALLAAKDPSGTTKGVADGLATASEEINALATAPKPAAAPATPTTPAAAPAPAETADSLTEAEADQLKFGAGTPLHWASEQLQNPQPDMDAILARLKGVPGVLRSFSKPAALAPQLQRKALSVEISVRTLEAVHSGAQGAISQAMEEWRNAIGLLQGLTAKTPAGAASAEKAEAPAADAGDAGNDDE